MASDGIDFLVAWTEGVTGADYIYAARVSAAGVVLDPGGQPVSTQTSGSDQDQAQVAALGSTYLVVWADCRNAASCDFNSPRSDTQNLDIYGARVSSAGAVLVSLPGWRSPPAARGRTFRSSPRTAPAGWWSGATPAPEQMHRNGTRVSSAAAVLDNPPLVIGSGPGSQHTPGLALYDGGYFAVWEDCRNGLSTCDVGRPDNTDVYGARVFFDGGVADPAGLAISTGDASVQMPRPACDSTGCLVVWNDSRDPVAGGTLYGTRVFFDGGVADPAGLPLCAERAEQSTPALASSGSSYRWSGRTGATTAAPTSSAPG